MLDGELEVIVDGEAHTVSAGGLAQVPADTEHSYRSVTDVHFLTIVSEGNAATFFAQLVDEVEMSPPVVRRCTAGPWRRRGPCRVVERR